MRTSVGLLAFAGFVVALGGPASAQEVVWRKNYLEARDQGQKAKKPLAVIVGSGPNGINQLSQDGPFSSDVRKILASDYIPLYLDSDSPDAKRLIEDLGIGSGKGIVLSDREGGSQAFFHDGNIPEKELLQLLAHYADPATIVRSTATLSTARFSFYPPNGTATSGGRVVVQNC